MAEIFQQSLQGFSVEALNGLLILSNDAGDITQECFYQNGLLEQKLKIFIYKQLYIETDYVQGKKHGEHCIYNDSGKVIARQHYKNDLLQGKSIWYDDEGNIIKFSHYNENQLHGLSYLFMNNKKTEKILYRRGELICKIQYGEKPVLTRKRKKSPPMASTPSASSISQGEIS